MSNNLGAKIVRADPIIFLVTLIILAEQANSTNYYDFLENPIQGCAMLGYPKSTLNECGYCVGNDTGLDEDYGKDCLGVCHGSAIFDCKNVCNGTAYRDKCTNQCLDEASELPESTRDCRGECIRPNLPLEQLPYRLDECGYCRLQSSELSPYIDCSKQCHPPGLSTSRSVCGFCINPSSNITEEDVKDECGNCLQDGAYCSCSRDPKLCGCDNADHCYKIRSVEPKMIEKGTESQILLIGYFHPMSEDLDCVYRHEANDEEAYAPIFFIPKNRTAVYCSIYPVIEGSYSIGLRSRSKNHNLPETSSIKIFAFDLLKARITGMQPAEMTTTEFTEDLELTFVGPSLSAIPDLRLICLVSKSEGDSEEEDSSELYEPTSILTITGNKPYTCILPKSQSASSTSLLITPTIDGVNPLSSPFTFTLISPAPTISHANCFISSDGLAMIVMFTRPVDVYSSLEMLSVGSNLCDHILTDESLDKLAKYKRLNCVWSSKVQLVIYLQKPMEENIFELSLRKGIFKEDSSNIALVNDEPIKIVMRKLTTEWWVYTPRLVITGPSEVPRCGLFSLSGHYSSPKGTTGVAFKWTVTRDNLPSTSTEEPINEELTHIVSSTTSQNLILDAILFQPGVSYQFTLTTQSDLGSLIATHRLIRFNYDAPIVSIYSNIMLPAQPYTIDTTAVFWAETYIPTCIHPFQRVGIFWKVADPHVKFNFTLAYLSVYILSPFSLPPDRPVTFYLNAFLGHRINETSGAAFSLIGLQPPLQALIANGSPMIALGHESGPIMISGSASGDGTKKPLSFHWNCLDSDTHEPCFFNFASLDDSDLEIASNRNYVLIDSTMQRQPELLLDSSNFMPNRELILSLQVHDRNDTNRVSNPELTLLKITSGDAPQVFMGSIYISRKYRANIRSPHNLAIMVPAHTPLLIKGTVKSSVPLSYLAWEANNFIHPLNWNTKRGSWRNGETHTELHIHSDHIYPYGLHVFKLKACNTNDQCSEATTQFTASQGVTQCSISIPAYHEYELVNVSVEKCNIPPGYGPLVYQLYAINEKTEEIFPITVPQFSNVFLFPGLPAIDQEKAENTFALKFCDTFNYCEMVYASPTTVYPNENKTSLIDDLLKLARKYNIGGDPFHAMQSLGIILKEASLDKPLQYKTMSETIDYNLEVLQRPSQLLNRGQLALSLGLLSEIVRKSDNNRLREKAMDAIRKLAEKGYSLEMIPDLMTIRSTMFNLMFPYSRGAGLIAKADDLPKTLKSSRKVFNVLLQMAAAQLSLGKRVEFGSYSEDLFEDEKQERIFKTIMIHDKTIEGTHLKIGDTEVTIKIGKSVKKRFAGSWKCTPDSLCNSVVYSYTVFPTSGPFPEVSDGYRIAPILMFNIFTPGTGKLQTIKTGLNAVEVTFTYTGNRSYGLDYSTKCKSWSDTKDSWKPDGVHLLRASHERISCWSGFIAPFTVYRIPQRWNVGAVASMVFGGLLFFILVGFTIIICSSKSPTAQRLSQPPFDRRMLRPMTE